MLKILKNISVKNKNVIFMNFVYMEKQSYTNNW